MFATCCGANRAQLDDDAPARELDVQRVRGVRLAPVLRRRHLHHLRRGRRLFTVARTDGEDGPHDEHSEGD